MRDAAVPAPARVRRYLPVAALAVAFVLGIGGTLLFQNRTTILPHNNDGVLHLLLGSAVDEAGNTVLIHNFPTPVGDYSTYLMRNSTGGFFKFVDAVDDLPLPPGGFSIGRDASGIIYYDAISVCGLGAQFTSLPVPVSAP